MNYVAEYDKLNDNVKSYLFKIRGSYVNDNKIKHKMESFNRKRDLSDNDKNKIFDYLLYSNYDTRHFLEKHYDLIPCYSKSGETIKMTKIYSSRRHTVIMEGKYNNATVIIKFHISDKRHTDYEIRFYNKLKDMGCDLPWFSPEFMFMNEQILVLDKLEKLNKDDDIYEIGRDVVRELSYLHQFGIHCDIKPDNIMKKKINGKYKYYLIDYGGASSEKLGGGFHRFIWSPKYTSQRRGERDQVTYPRVDFVELAYTLNFIHNKCSDKDFKNICSSCLGSYYRHINKLGPKLYKDIDYNHIISLLHD